MSAPPALPDAAACAQLDAQIERLLRCSPLPEPEVKVRRGPEVVVGEKGEKEGKDDCLIDGSRERQRSAENKTHP